MQKIELLSPAGNIEKLKYAFAFGADAVYAGVPRFSLRARENDFTDESIEEAVNYTHYLGKRIYLTLNIFPHNRKIESFKKVLDWMKTLQPDAIILSDPGVIYFASEICPEIPIHLSTQANTVNWASVKFWNKQGVSRIILSRELSIEEISDIHKNNPEVELESFVHGAICVAHSGRCLLSNYFNHRDPNQGTCTNSCRWEYNIYEEKPKSTPEYLPIQSDFYIEEKDRPGNLLQIDEDEHGTYIMNSKDLCAINLLDQLKIAGISSFKIEGRTKSVYYVSIITRAYRRAIDDLYAGKEFDKSLKEEVYSVANRDYTTGFLEKNPLSKGENYVNSHAENQSHTFCGIVKEYDQNVNSIKISLRNRFETGDLLELVTADETVPFKVMEIKSNNGEIKTAAHGGGEDVWINYPKKMNTEYALIRRPVLQEAFK
jgi:U32 family peptidase